MSNLGQSIGCAILGSGFMGRTYSETIAKFVKGAHLAGASGGSRAPALAADYGMKHYPSWRDLVQSREVDAVFIATPHNLHAEQALAAAQAGKHLLIEKPMACTTAECDAVLEACRAKNLKCSIAFTQRYRVCNASAKALLDSGKLGKVQQIRTYQMVPGGMPNLPAWQVDADNMGMLFGHGIHNFDNARWICGQEIATVYAKCRSLDPIRSTEGTADVIMTMSGGAIVYLFCSFQVPKPGFPRSQFAYRVICEKGLLDIDAYGEARASIDGGAWETIAMQPPIDWQGKGFLDPVRLESYEKHLQDFIDAIREDRDPAITGWDGRQAVAAALAAYESNREGKEIRL